VPSTLPNPQAELRVAGCLDAIRRLDAPAPLRFWHLASLDAPTVAVVWSLAFAWAAGIRLPVWIPALLALVAWTVYIADRLLDARSATGIRGLDGLRERHLFHWRYRRIFLPLAVASSCAAACIVLSFMPTAARERESVLAVAALAYFTRVHSFRRLQSMRLSSPFHIVKKELLVGLLFTAACALPAFSRAIAQSSLPLWPLSAAIVFFALLAWLNCHAIEHWESEPSQVVGEGCFSGAKAPILSASFMRGLKPPPPSVSDRIMRRMKPQLPSLSDRIMRRLKPPPPSVSDRIMRRMKPQLPSLSDRTMRRLKPQLPSLSAHIMRRLQPEPPFGSSFPAACVLALTGLLLACALSLTQSRSAALVASGAVSAVLLALLDRMRNSLTPVALRLAADLVLLTPLALLLK
jgi:hypothetical protein